MRNNQSMKDFVLDLLRNNLPEYYFYHNPDHTLYVEAKSQEIGKYEECTDDELELLSVAALWHDTGYILTYNNHEEESIKITRKHLPRFDFSVAEIDRICGMIMATKIPQMPQNKLEEILADADLEYLGTASFEIKSVRLLMELQSINSTLGWKEWNRMQIQFLQQHQYYTSYCLKYREPLKQVHLNKLIVNSL
jgi:uncharacterized protein